MEQHLADNGTVINLLVSKTTLSTSKIDAESLGLKKKDIPKEIVKEMSTMQLVDPKILTPMGNCTKAAQRTLEKVGTRFMGSSVYFIPDTEIKSVMEELTKLRDQFYQHRSELIASYDESVERWAKECDEKYPGWGKIILAAKKPSQEVKDACCFEVVPCSVGAPKQDALGKLYESNVGGLHIQALREVASNMRSLYENSYKNKERAGHRTLTSIAHARNKLHGLRFVSSILEKVVELIDKTLEDVPKRKNLVGNHFLAVSHLIQLLSDPDRVIQHVLEHKSEPLSKDQGQMNLIDSNSDTPDEVVFESEMDEAVEVEGTSILTDKNQQFDLENWL